MKTRRAISPTGWWIAGLLERHKNSGRAAYWNNYRLIRAEHWRDAFQKALAHGRSDCEIGSREFSGSTEFVGVTDLVPIYEPFEDGAEMLWEEYDQPEGSSEEAPLDTYSEAEMAAFYEPTSQSDATENV